MAEMQKVLTGQSLSTTDLGTCDSIQSSGDELCTEAGPPSIGSMLHGEGNCKPCAWFWKPQGCRNGKDCLHCHVCPCSEIKARKKKQCARYKMAELESAVSTATSTPCPDVALFLPPPGLTALSDGEESLQEAFPSLPPAQPVEPPSLGSMLHGSGGCKPCAWFWHPKGCGNGFECTFCHICPPGEIKSRRKLKILQMRQEPADCAIVEEQDLPLPGSTLIGEKMTEELNQVVHHRQAATAKLEADLHTALDGDRTPAKVIIAESWTSLGSQMHGTGECRPCAWFWKKGCLNGRDCLHCHLCPEGELRRKKKAAAKLRAMPGSDVRQMADALTLQQQIIQQQQRTLADLQLQLQLQQSLMASSATSTSPLLAESFSA
mmetsp:Transcript_26873/g.62378  ORF Transcript_26873/g.62378 Transcript_26873/m.62378 type:complete len:377 (-) Transcript_26873:82-1212(-)